MSRRTTSPAFSGRPCDSDRSDRRASAPWPLRRSLRRLRARNPARRLPDWSPMGGGRPEGRGITLVLRTAATRTRAARALLALAPLSALLLAGGAAYGTPGGP